jgi:DNA-binding transcriptional regulator YiaG
VSGNEDLTPQEMADNIRAMRRAEEVTQEQFGAFAAQPGWTV